MSEIRSVPAGEGKLPECLRDLREVSLEGLKLIGKGSCGDVYLLDAEKVIKVYSAHPETPERAGREAAVSEAVRKAGLPTVRCFETVRCGGCAAAIYEKAEGRSGEDILKEDPSRAEELAEKLAQLGRQLHRTPADPAFFPDAKLKLGKGSAGALLRGWLNPEEIRRWEALLDAVPDPHAMVHTDFHLGNVMFRGDEMKMIDVGAVSHGHPLQDLISLYLAANEPQLTKIELAQPVSRRVFDAFVRAYFGPSFGGEGEALLAELLRFMAALPYTPLFCAAFPSESADPMMRQWLRARLDLVLSFTPEGLRQKFDRLDRLAGWSFAAGSRQARRPDRETADADHENPGRELQKHTEERG